MVVIKEIEAAATPWSAASSFMESSQPTVFFEQQVEEGGALAYSILLHDPTCWMREVNGRFVEGPGGEEIDDPIAWMKAHHEPHDYRGPLPFVGGLAGYLDFEFGWILDDINGPLRRSATPRAFVGVFPEAAIYDHLSRTWSVVSSGKGPSKLEERIRDVGDAVRFSSENSFGERKAEPSAQSYQKGVMDAIDAIYEGEFFEVNYTERFQGEWKGDRRALYDRLRRTAPGEYGGLVDIDGAFIASVSPEQFLAVDAVGRVSSRPIKGTRPRGQTAQEDDEMARLLLASEKDRAENVMIVDLMRNDLTRVCEAGTVEVTELCGLYSFSSVHHLVSTIEGQLADEFSALDAFLSGFPAGSITGAPKVRAMEWISNHEATPRGPYTGSMFYWSNHGTLDSNVLIRTAVLVGDTVSYGSGGAVVAHSDPFAEYEEALWKARPFFEVLEER